MSTVNQEVNQPINQPITLRSILTLGSGLFLGPVSVRVAYDVYGKNKETGEIVRRGTEIVVDPSNAATQKELDFAYETMKATFAPGNVESADLVMWQVRTFSLAAIGPAPGDTIQEFNGDQLG